MVEIAGVLPMVMAVLGRVVPVVVVAVGTRRAHPDASARRMLAAALERERGPRRCSAVGSYTPLTEIVKTASAAAGKAAAQRRDPGRRRERDAARVWRRSADGVSGGACPRPLTRSGCHATPPPATTRGPGATSASPSDRRARRSTARSVGCGRSGVSDLDTSTLRRAHVRLRCAHPPPRCCRK